MSNQRDNSGQAQKVVATFGSSRPQPGSPGYEEARTVGRLLAESGFAVSTGGYGGTMAAASQGAAEAGGHVIGICCDNIEAFRPIGPNQWVGEVVRHVTLRDRLLNIVTENDAIIVLPGGIGTLSELALAWSLIQVGEIPARPLVLLGAHWKQTIETFMTDDHVAFGDRDLIYFATSPQTAVAHVRQSLLG